MPIYRPSSTPALISVINRYSGRTEHWPIPRDAQPAPEADHHMGVISGGTIYEMWDASWNSNGTITAGGMASFDLSGLGISNPPNIRVTASGLAVSGGMILEQDLRAGVIDHALAGAIPSSACSRTYVSPAVGYEVSCNNSSGLPMGARLALPKGLNIDSLAGLHPLTKMILKAAQDYGIYINDANGASLYKGQAVTTLRVEPGSCQTMGWGSCDNLLSRVADEVYNVVQTYGLKRVN